MAITQKSRWDDAGVEPPAGEARYVAGEQPIAEYDNWFNRAVVDDIAALNQWLDNLGITKVYIDTEANKPASGKTTELFIAIDTNKIYRGTGTGWQLLTTEWNAILNKPSVFPPEPHQHDWSEILNTPDQDGDGLVEQIALKIVSEFPSSPANGEIFAKDGKEYRYLNGAWYRVQYSSAWWNPNWLYRKEIIITETAGVSRTNAVVCVEFDHASLVSASKSNSDASDIRFVAEDNKTLLDYFIERPTIGTSKCRAWVKIPSIPANGSVTIYMYYGNASATAADNPSAVFDVWDDFDDGVWDDRWTKCYDYDGTATITEQESELQIYSTWYVGLKLINELVEDIYIVVAAFRVVETDAQYGNSYIMLSNDPTDTWSTDLDGYGFQVQHQQHSSGREYLVAKSDGNSSASVSEEKNYSSHSWYPQVLMCGNGNQKAISQNELTLTDTNFSSFINVIIGGNARYYDSDTQTSYPRTLAIDYVGIAKYEENLSVTQKRYFEEVRA